MGQDLWPNSVLLSGYIKNDLILKIITKIIKKNIYSDIILVQSPDFINEVYITIKKLFIVPIQLILSLIKPIKILKIK